MRIRAARRGHPAASPVRDAQGGAERSRGAHEHHAEHERARRVIAQGHLADLADLADLAGGTGA
ncbi:hypothetical protein ACH4SK_16745 [Streptomyces inhibens]|uniref:hypothetical protein n=1 Tax=Streptomyces inhibens TaxID=2293571 RepID=UPI00379B4267